jgi:hypothetical protein
MVPVGVEIAEDGLQRTVYRSTAELLAEAAEEQRIAAELAGCAVTAFGRQASHHGRIVGELREAETSPDEIVTPIAGS